MGQSSAKMQARGPFFYFLLVFDDNRFSFLRLLGEVILSWQLVIIVYYIGKWILN